MAEKSAKQHETGTRKLLCVIQAQSIFFFNPPSVRILFLIKYCSSVLQTIRVKLNSSVLERMNLERGICVQVMLFLVSKVEINLPKHFKTKNAY